MLCFRVFSDEYLFSLRRKKRLQFRQVLRMRSEEDNNYPQLDFISELLMPEADSPELQVISSAENLIRQANPIDIYDVKIIQEFDELQREEEIIENFEFEGSLDGDFLNLNQLLNQIHEATNIKFECCDISIYCPEAEIFVNFGVFPYLSTNKCNLSQFLIDKMLTILVKRREISGVSVEMLQNMAPFQLSGPPQRVVKTDEVSPRLLRKASVIKNKQTIGYIIARLIRVKSKKGRTEMEGWTQKSLQDYYYHVKVGHKHGFDFNSNYDKNFSVLRRYVKRQDRMNHVRQRKATEPTNEEVNRYVRKESSSDE